MCADGNRMHVAPLKPEFLISEVVFSKNDISNLDATIPSDGHSLDEKQKPKFKGHKLKGQNKNRPPPHKFLPSETLCPKLIEGDGDVKCQEQRCNFIHDVAAYMAKKAADLGPKCHLFDLLGKCPWGLACRYGSSHISCSHRNITDTEKWSKSLQNLSASNAFHSHVSLSKDVQISLRKRKYNFDPSAKVLSKRPRVADVCSNSDVNAYSTCNGNNSSIINGNAKPSQPTAEVPSCQQEPERSEHSMVEAVVHPPPESDVFVDKNNVGPLSDEDIIKLRPEERKKIDWSGKLYLAPLTTVGNLPFRRICKKFGADITCSEMVMATSLLEGSYSEWALTKHHDTEDIFGIQVCGNNPAVLTKCSQLLSEQTKFDFIDINLGCPIDMVYRQGSGSGLLRRKNILRSVISCMKGVIDVPLTVKSRTGVYMDKPIAHNLISDFRELGVDMVTLHGRSREQRYTRLADWDYIKKCANICQPVPLFGSGDILSYEEAIYHQENSGVSGIMLARGALMKPWIFTEIKEQRHWDISSSERFDILKEYANFGLEHWGSDNRGVETARRFLLEWLSFCCRYIPVGLLERLPQKINERPPRYRGRDDLESLMASQNCRDWIKISEMLLGTVPENFVFVPKHKANSWSS